VKPLLRIGFDGEIFHLSWLVGKIIHIFYLHPLLRKSIYLLQYFGRFVEAEFICEVVFSWAGRVFFGSAKIYSYIGQYYCVGVEIPLGRSYYFSRIHDLLQGMLYTLWRVISSLERPYVFGEDEFLAVGAEVFWGGVVLILWRSIMFYGGDILLKRSI
jgi:hypothetical protein